MRTLQTLSIAALAALISSTALAGEFAYEHALQVQVGGIDASGALHKTHALCIPTIDGKKTKGENVRPNITWSAGPKGTKSYAVIVSDADVPADFSQANTTTDIAADAPRQTLYHWVWFDLPPQVTAIPAGPATLGHGHGAPNDVSHTTNYDGPCPPWNDLRVHQYRFTVLALDIARLRPQEGASTASIVADLEAHALAKGDAVGSFTLHPKLRRGL